MRFPLKLVADNIVDPSSYLHGGRIYGRTYLIAIIEADNIVEVYEGQLRNNCRSQRQSYEEGYQPFLIKDHEWNYDIKAKTIETRRIIAGKFAGKYYVHRLITKQNAVILKAPPESSEQFHLLKTIQSRTWLEEQLRRSIGEDFEKLDIAAELSQEAVLGVHSEIPLAAIAPPDKRFELYVHLASNHFLQALYSLLEMKVSVPTNPLGSA